VSYGSYDSAPVTGNKYQPASKPCNICGEPITWGCRIEGRPAQIELPSSVVLKVVESAEGVRGDSANNVQKPATLETGKIINVPLFIKEGEIIKISTEDGSYLGRS
jgi:hypothetical protein